MKKLLLALSLAAFAGGAFSQARPEYGPTVSTGTAKRIAAATIAECQKNGWRVSVAVVDNHGFLLYFERMDNTQYASNDIAIGKARAAATFQRPTRAFVDAIAKGGPAVMSLGQIYASPGGLPLMADGRVIGAVGVSGVTGDQDEQCAKAGVSVL